MVNPMLWYLFLAWFKLEIISVFPLLLHACTDLKYIFLVWCVGKGNHLQKNIAVSTLGWCLATVIVFSGLFCDALVSFGWPYHVCWIVVVFIWLMLGWCCQWSSISFFSLTGSLRTCSDGYPTSYCSIIDASDPSILSLWKYDLLHFTVSK